MKDNKQLALRGLSKRENEFPRYTRDKASEKSLAMTIHIKKVMGKITLTFLIFSLLAACSPVVNNDTRATSAAQGTQVVLRATQMGQKLQQTEAAGGPIATSTQRAILSLKLSASQWPMILSDTFPDNSLKWPVGVEESDLSKTDWEVKDGKYWVQATAKQGFVYWNHPEGDEVADFYLSVDAQQISGTETAEYGVIFRETIDDYYYLFEISNTGEYALFLRSQGDWSTLIDWTESPAILPGEVNQIAVIGLGSSFLFFLNDEFVTGTEDSTLASGLAGVAIGLSNEGEQVEVEFDNFVLRSTSPTPTPGP